LFSLDEATNVGLDMHILAFNRIDESAMVSYN